MGNRIDQVFESLKKENRAAFIPYLSAGDPDLDTTLEILHALDRAGADLIEIGVPFSDPLADGLVNQGPDPPLPRKLGNAHHSLHLPQSSGDLWVRKIPRRHGSRRS